MWRMPVILLSLVMLCVHGQSIDQYEALRGELSFLAERMKDMEADNFAMKEEISKIRNATRLLAEPICFSAVKVSTQGTSSGDNILFEEELIDTHDTFNTVFGIYVIPETGVYEVTVTLFKYDSTSASYNDTQGLLYVGSTFLTQIFNSYGSDTGATAYSTASIIRVFDAGDALRVESGADKSFYGSSSYKASQFSALYLGPAA